MKSCPLCVASVAGLSIAGVAFLAGHLTASTGSAPLAAVAESKPAAAAPAAAAAKTGAYKVDSGHSSMAFNIKHMNVAYFYGRFDKISGSFDLNKAKPEASTLEVTIDADSISTANDKRDGHLKSQDFFSTKEFSTLTFKSKSVKSAGENKYEVTGDLTLRGQTKPLTVTVEDTGRGAGRTGEVAGLRTTFTIKRSDFGMNFMVGKGLADEVEITVSLEGGR
jgi:polyisoprenoid-binding protein YceI